MKVTARRGSTFNVIGSKVAGAGCCGARRSMKTKRTASIRPSFAEVSVGDGRAVGSAPHRSRQAASAVRRHHASCAVRRLREDLHHTRWHFDAIGLRVIMQWTTRPSGVGRPNATTSSGMRPQSAAVREDEIAVARQRRAGRAGIPPGAVRHRRARFVHARTLGPKFPIVARSSSSTTRR